MQVSVPMLLYNLRGGETEPRAGLKGREVHQSGEPPDQNHRTAEGQNERIQALARCTQSILEATRVQHDRMAAAVSAPSTIPSSAAFG